MMPGDAPAFVPEGTFVIQLKTSEAGAADSLAGRAEHVVSGQARHFTSPAELLAFLGDMLRPYLPHEQIDGPRSVAGMHHRRKGGSR